MLKKTLNKIAENMKDMRRRAYIRMRGKAKARDVLERVEQFPEGRQMMRFLKKHDVQIILQRNKPKSNMASFQVTITSWANTHPDLTQKLIMINGMNTQKNWGGSLFHEAQHMSQILNADMLYPTKLCSPQDFLWHNRVMEADAQAKASEMLYLWQCETGEKDEIQAIKAQTNYGPMYEAFEQACAEDPKNLNNGVARRRAFDCWFEQRIYSGHDYDIQAVTDKIPGWLFLMQKHQPKIEITPLTPADMEPLGCVNFNGTSSEKNYLTLPGFRPLDDPFYTQDFDAVVLKKMVEVEREHKSVVSFMKAVADKNMPFFIKKNQKPF